MRKIPWAPYKTVILVLLIGTLLLTGCDLVGGGDDGNASPTLAPMPTGTVFPRIKTYSGIVEDISVGKDDWGGWPLVTITMAGKSFTVSGNQPIVIGHEYKVIIQRDCPGECTWHMMKVEIL